MRKLFIASLALLPVLTAGATCPVLPQDAGLAWQATQTDDGMTCYALQTDGAMAFGLWVGTTRVDMPVDPVVLGSGQIAGIPILWVKAKSHNSRQALATLGAGTNIHAFVPDSPADTLQLRLAQLAALPTPGAP